MNTNLELEVTQLHAEICAGLADPNRILILYELSQSPHNVTELSTNLKMPQPLVSRHLKILRERGMVIPGSAGALSPHSPACFFKRPSTSIPRFSKITFRERSRRIRATL